MTTQLQTATPAHDVTTTTAFTATEWQVLLDLRTRYAQWHDLLSSRELARLRFLRWLVQTGRLAP
jgi:hypothetical protein